MRYARDDRQDYNRSYKQAKRYERLSYRRKRNPADTPYKAHPLAHLIVTAVQEALDFHPHPDSSRQRKSRCRDVAYRQARKMKNSDLCIVDLPVVWEPKRIYGRWDQY